MNAEKLANNIIQALSAFSDKPGKGIIVFVKSNSPSKVKVLALLIAEKHPVGPVPIYLVDGSILGEHSWPFSRIKKQARIRLETSGKMLVESGGTIFPEDHPILLLAEHFDNFQGPDQRSYCHLVDGEGYPNHALHQGSILLCGCSKSSKGQVETGSISRGLVFDLEEEKG